MCSYVNITGVDVEIDAQNQSSIFVLDIGSELRLEGINLLNGGYHRATGFLGAQDAGGGECCGPRTRAPCPYRAIQPAESCCAQVLPSGFVALARS